jgi:hypothetical protein
MQTVSAIDMAIDMAIESEYGISGLESPLLRQVTVLIAAKFEKKDLEKPIIRFGPAPRWCLYAMEGSSLFEMLSIDLTISRKWLGETVRHSWVCADKDTVFGAVSCSNAAAGIELFEEIRSKGFDFSPPLFQRVLPRLAAIKSKPQMLQYILDFFSIKRPPDSLVLEAVQCRTTGIADTLQYLISRDVDLGWMNPAPYGGWGDPREQAQMGHKGKAGRKTALHAAAEKGDVQLVRLLLSHSARSDLKDFLGRKPYDRAKFMNQTESFGYS